MNSYQYAQLPSGTIHLMRESEALTLCGRRPAEWIGGDETTSGIAATCETCRKVITRSNWVLDRTCKACGHDYPSSFAGCPSCGGLGWYAGPAAS
jgi:hypothetical protein